MPGLLAKWMMEGKGMEGGTMHALIAQTQGARFSITTPILRRLIRSIPIHTIDISRVLSVARRLVLKGRVSEQSANKQEVRGASGLPK